MDGAVEQPVAAGDMEGGEGRADEGGGAEGFGDFPVGAVEAGHVPDAVVTAEQEDGVCECGFDGDEEIVAVEPEFGIDEGGEFDAVSGATVELFVGAGAAGDGETLALGERVAVAGESEGGAEGVAAIEEPVEVAAGGLERGVMFGREESGVFRMGAAVFAVVGHDWKV